MAKAKTISEENLFKSFKGPWWSRYVQTVLGSGSIRRSIPFITGTLLLGVSVYFALQWTGFLNPTPSALTNQYRQQIQSAEPQQTPKIFQQMASEKNAEVLSLLCEQLKSDQKEFRDNSAKAIEDAIRNWKSWPREESHQQVVWLSEGLAKVAGRLQAPQQRKAIWWSQSFLNWPKSVTEKKNTLLIGYCEKIIRDSELAYDPLLVAGNTQQSDADNLDENNQGGFNPGSSRISGTLASFSTGRNANEPSAKTASPEIPIFSSDGQRLSIEPLDPTTGVHLPGGVIGVEVQGKSPAHTPQLIPGIPKPLNAVQGNAGILNNPHSTGSNDSGSDFQVPPDSAFRGPGEFPKQDSALPNPNLRTPSSSPQGDRQPNQIQDRTDWDKLRPKANSNERSIEKPLESGERNPGHNLPIPSGPGLQREPTKEDLIAGLKVSEYTTIQLMKLLHSPNLQTAAIAHRNLSKRLKNPAFVEAAFSLYHPNEQARIQLVKKLINSNSTLGVLFLKELAQDPQPKVAQPAISFLLKFPDRSVQRFARKMQEQRIQTATLPNLNIFNR